jgi:hypothetical protein
MPAASPEFTLTELATYFPRNFSPLPQLKWQQLRKSKLFLQVQEVYAELGGLGDKLPLKLLAFTAEAEQLAFVYDAPLHFNKYRQITLRAALYEQLPQLEPEKMRSWCKVHQREALKGGLIAGNWHSAEAARYFGPAEAPGDLGGNGSNAWKLRAFTDFLQDVASLLLPYTLVRVSPYHEIFTSGKRLPLSQLLHHPTEEQEQMLVRWLSRKAQVEIPEKAQIQKPDESV